MNALRRALALALDDDAEVELVEAPPQAAISPLVASAAAPRVRRRSRRCAEQGTCIRVLSGGGQPVVAGLAAPVPVAPVRAPPAPGPAALVPESLIEVAAVWPLELTPWTTTESPGRTDDLEVV
jgi:hypothetical protein